MRRRLAFTIVELLVAMAIVALLSALLISAIQSSRESARRLSCANNLRQIGVALHSHHGVRRAYPAMVVWSPPGEPLGFGIVPIGAIDRVARGLESDTIHANWLIALLPFLEEQPLFDTMDPRQPISAECHTLLRTAQLPILKCPSDPFTLPDQYFERGLSAGLSGNKYARGNYAINVGPDAACIKPGTAAQPCSNGFTAPGNLATTNSQLWGSGIAGINKTFNASTVTDGLTHTIAVVEIRAGIDPMDPGVLGH